MKNWFRRLLALLTPKGRARSSLCVDWHGRPLAESADGTVPQAGVREGAVYTTLSLPARDGAARSRPVLAKGGER
jgi:hypothetical protein